MRRIQKKHSTKHERVFYEVLKELKIPFKHRWIIQGRECDFLIGNVCIEIDGHEQDGNKNHIFAELGYIPIHLHNSEINRQNIIKLINNYEFNKLSKRSI